MEKLIEKNFYLNKSAKDGYRSYLHAYASYSLKSIFDVNHLDLRKVASAFGFSVPPKVNLNVGSAAGKGKDQRRSYGNSGGDDKNHFQKQRGSLLKGDGKQRQWSK